MNQTEYHLTCPYETMPSHSHAAILDIGTTGRFWRTSDLTHLTVIKKTGGAKTASWCGRCFLVENADDEYELLQMLPDVLKDVQLIITFNGHSFDLPYLKKKLISYGLPDPFTGHSFRDLLTDYRPLKTFLGLPSCRLEDFFAFLLEDTDNVRVLSLKDDPRIFRDDAVRTLMILALDSYIQLACTDRIHLVSSARRDEHIEYRLSVEHAFPRHYSVHEGPFHLITEGNEAALSIRTYNNQVRFYHSDVKNYIYLPAEGYSVHRSMASLIDPSRKEKAVRENCFHLIPYRQHLLMDDPQTTKLIKSALQYLLPYPDPYRPSRKQRPVPAQSQAPS